MTHPANDYPQPSPEQTGSALNLDPADTVLTTEFGTDIAVIQAADRDIQAAGLGEVAIPSQSDERLPQTKAFVGTLVTEQLATMRRNLPNAIPVYGLVRAVRKRHQEREHRVAARARVAAAFKGVTKELTGAALSALVEADPQKVATFFSRLETAAGAMPDARARAATLAGTRVARVITARAMQVAKAHADPTGRARQELVASTVQELLGNASPQAQQAAIHVANKAMDHIAEQLPKPPRR